MLVKAGMQTIQTIGVPKRPIAADVDAVVEAPTLFGRNRYASIVERLSAPSQIVQALAPLAAA